MRFLLLLTFVANLVLALVTVLVGPEQMATHFAVGGDPDGWMSSSANALLMCGISLLMFLMFYCSPQLLRILSARWINVPHREYWLHEHRIADTRAILARQLYVIGVATFLMMLAVGGLALQANFSDPVHLREDLAWWALGLYGACTIFWCVKLYLAFRLPTSD